MTTLEDVKERSQHPLEDEPPPVPAARRHGGSDRWEHAQPGADWPTLCGLPAEQVTLYRHLFYPNGDDACPQCAERLWRLDPSGPIEDYVGLVWVDDAPALRMSLRARGVKDAYELLKMRFGDTSVVSVWNEDAANRPQMTDFFSDVDRLATADQVVVISGAAFDPKNRSNNKQLAVEREPAEIIRIARLLTDYLPGDPMDWMEWPSTSIVFLQARQTLAEYGLLGRGWVRTPAAGDREICKPEPLRAWLRNRGIELG